MSRNNSACLGRGIAFIGMAWLLGTGPLSFKCFTKFLSVSPWYHATLKMPSCIPHHGLTCIFVGFFFSSFQFPYIVHVFLISWYFKHCENMFFNFRIKKCFKHFMWQQVPDILSLSVSKLKSTQNTVVLEGTQSLTLIWGQSLMLNQYEIY